MRINTKLLINIFLPICITLTILVIISSALKTRNEAERKNRVALSLLSDMSQLNQRTYYYLLYREKRAQKEWLAIYDSLSSLTSRLTFGNAEQDRIIEGVRHNLSEMKTIFSDRLVSGDAGAPGIPPELARERRDRLSSQLLVRARSISADAFRLYEMSTAESRRHTTKSNTLILLLLLSSILISLATLLPINRSLSRSISLLTTGAAIVGSGNLDHKIRLATNDEIGQLSAAFNAMTENLKSLTVSRDELAKEVAERKRAENALRRSEAILAQAGQMAHLGAWELEFVNEADPDANPLQWSEEVYRIFGYQPGSVAVSNILFFERVHPDDRQAVRDAVAQAIATKTAYAIEHRIIRTDGTVRTVYEHGDIVFADGRPLRIIGAVQDITGRKRAEEALRISEENYRTIFNSANDAILIHDIRSAEILDVNDTMLHLYGYSREELRTLGVEALSAGTEGDRQQDVLRAIAGAAAGEPHVFEWRAKNKAGRTFWVEVSLKRISLGGIDRLLAVVRDIESRKRNEEAFRKVSRQNELILEYAGEGIFGLDLQGNVTVVNTVAAHMLGYERQELIGSHSHSKWHSKRQDGSDYPAQECPIYAAYAEGTVRSGEDFFWKKDGTCLPVEFTSRPLFEEGRITGAVVMYRDITERRKSEENIRKQAELINLAYDSIFVRGADDRITFWSRGAVAMYGWSADEAIGQSSHDLLKTGFPAPLADIRRELAENGMWEGELEHSRIDGSRITVESRWALVRDDAGRLREIMEANRDITARKQAEDELKRLVGELERSNKELEQFAYVASHDLQEPLRMVASYVQLLERRYKGRLDEKADRFIFFAVDGVQRMQKLIDGLLAYSRVARGARFVPVDMNTVFSQAVSNLAVAIRESGAEVERGRLPVVRGDEMQLQQLLQNLIGNGIKYRKPDIAPRVVVSATSSGREWVFSVTDNGIGIDPQFFPRIFLIFQRLHSRDEYPGTGLGLSLCKRIVERHGGRIWVESEPGKGSTFFFAIPEKKAAAAVTVPQE